MTHAHRRVALASCLTLVLVAGFPQTSWSLPRTWIGGNVDWLDAGSTANWNPADEPDPDDEAIFNTANTVNLGTANSILALTMSGGIDLNTNDQDLTVDGLVQLINADTDLIVGGSASLVQADSLTINSGGNVQMAGGQITVIEETGNGLLDINAGGTLSGHGSVHLNDGLLAVTTLLSNDGAISASHLGLTIFSAPIVDTLTITASSSIARIDLDGAGGLGAVNVNRNQTLDVNGTLTDSFSGSINMFQNSVLDISTPWTLDIGTITADNGFVAGGFGFPDVPAGVSTIDGGALTQTGGTITVTDTDGTLRFNTGFVMNGGTLTNNGLVIFDADATIAAAANFAIGSTADYTVEASRTVTINQTNFNMDGNVAGATRVTVNSGGLLTINVSDYDSDAATNRFDGVVTLNSGDIDVSSADAEFVMDGTLNMNFTTPGQLASWNGEPLDIGDDAGVHDAKINVTGGSVSRISSQVDFNSDADVDVGAGASLDFTGTVIFQSVNAANSAEFTGAGELSFTGQVNVEESTTLNMTGGSVDLDGADAFGDFINVDATLIINAQSMLSFGKVNVGGTNTLDIDNLNGGNLGSLTVNLDSATAEWTLNAQGVMNLVNDTAAATLLAGSDVNLNGTVNVTGDVRTTARVDVGGTVNINTVGEPLRLAGGNDTSDPNTIAGGTINGPGILGADTGKALHGFGTINASIDFDGLANLRADNGTLTINGAIVDAGTVGTVDGDGILNIPAAWNSSSVNSINMRGGELKGGTITIDNSSGINGQGLVSSRVINNTQIAGQTPTGTLIVQTAANDNDWDGAGNAGELVAAAGGVLELRDTVLFGFTGKVSATGGRVFTNGFALDFNPGSTINLGGGGGGGTYESTNSTDIGGTVTVAAGTDSTIEVQVNRFLTLESTSVTTLNGNLRLVSNNGSIAAGATFSGTGALIVPANSHLILEPNANANVLLNNDGTLRPNGFNTVGRVDVKDYQQGATGTLISELAGVGLNQFDRLIVNGNAVLHGTLDVDLEGGFVPTLGNTFPILSATAGLSGTFAGYQLPSIGAVNSLAVAYGANIVTIQVIAGLWGDYNGNGVVDAADYVVWRNTLGAGVAAFSGADGSGNGLVDQADYDLWRSRFGTVLGPGAGSGAGASANAAVPEPSTMLLLFAAAGWCLRRHRAA